MVLSGAVCAFPGVIMPVLPTATLAAVLLAAVSLSPAQAVAHPSHAVGLGAVLTSKSGGQIFGFDIDREGNDGVLATASSVEVFDQDKGKVIRSLGHFTNQDSDYVAYGIAAGDVGLIDHEVVPDGELF